MLPGGQDLARSSSWFVGTAYAGGFGIAYRAAWTHAAPRRAPLR